MVRVKSQGILLYCAVLLVLIGFGVFLAVRRHHPSVSATDLVYGQPKILGGATDPCGDPIGSEASIKEFKQHVQVNFQCPTVTRSPNTLNLAAFGDKPTVQQVLNGLFTIKRLNYSYTDDTLLASIGNIKNTDSLQWTVYQNGVWIQHNLAGNIVKPGDTLEVKYEP